jgi:hypothetical protein
VQKDIDAGFVEQFHGSLDDARRRWPKGIAVGKIGIAFAPGKDDRLTMDSTAPAVNPGLDIRERAYNPCPSDVNASMDNAREDRKYVGFSMDVSAAHKRMRIL